MRKIFYLIILLILSLAAVEFFRKFNQAKGVSSVAYNDDKAESSKGYSKGVGEYLSASVAHRSGNYDEAIKYYEKSLANNPSNTDIPKKLYGLYFYKGMYDEVIDLSRRHLEIDSLNKVAGKDLDPNPYMIVAVDYFKNGEYQKASDVLKPLIDPKIADKSHIDGVVVPLIAAWSYVAQADYKQAFDVIDNITTSYMLSVFSYNRALINDIANGKTVTVEGEELDIEKKASSLISEIFYEIGQYSLQGYNFDEAIIYYRLACFLNPESDKLKKVLAMAFEAKGEYGKAISIYDDISSEEESYDDIKISRALAYHKLGENKKAIDILKALLPNEKYTYKGLLAIGSILMSEDKYKDAIKYFEKAEKRIESFSKDHWNLYFNMGVSYDRLNDFDNAEANLKKAIQLFPENPESLNYLAYSWIIKNKNIKQAREMLEAAVIRSGGAPHILDSYGWALYKIKAYNDALPFLEQAALALPYNSIINDHLGDLYWVLGREREAKFQWERAIYYYDDKIDASQEVKIEDIKKKLKNGIAK